MTWSVNYSKCYNSPYQRAVNNDNTSATNASVTRATRSANYSTCYSPYKRAANNEDASTTNASVTRATEKKQSK